MYTIVSACTLGALALVWNKDNGLNIIIKLTLAAVSVWGIVTYVE